jgi:hypothetical protein
LVKELILSPNPVMAATLIGRLACDLLLKDQRIGENLLRNPSYRNPSYRNPSYNWAQNCARKDWEESVGAMSAPA